MDSEIMDRQIKRLYGVLGLLESEPEKAKQLIKQTIDDFVGIRDEELSETDRFDRLNPQLCPRWIREGIENSHRRKPGSFVQAVLHNDLITACLRADPETLAALPHIVGFLLEWRDKQLAGRKEIE